MLRKLMDILCCRGQYNSNHIYYTGTSGGYTTWWIWHWCHILSCPLRNPYWPWHHHTHCICSEILVSTWAASWFLFCPKRPLLPSILWLEWNYFHFWALLNKVWISVYSPLEQQHVLNENNNKWRCIKSSITLTLQKATSRIKVYRQKHSPTYPSMK